MLVAIIFLAVVSLGTPAIDTVLGVVLMFAIFAFIISLSLPRQGTAEIDLDARKVRTSRRYFGRLRMTAVDCPFYECSAIGTFESDNDGHPSYNVYVKLKGGTRHKIPLENSTLSEASRVASQLSATTGIPRLDIYVGPIYISPDNTSRQDE